jgi:ABC-2 type transport system ATP-binding protein
VLTTLLRPDAGHARVAGHDIATDGASVRRSIGLAGQHTSVDECLTGRANLVMLGRLSRMGRRQARDRAAHLLSIFGLDAAAGRPVRGYSGGMRRRLDLAASLLIQPRVLFLDEPTTGLDPASRLALWVIITDLVAGGTTLLLTTQYLEEADRLADRVCVIDGGRVTVEGTPGELKAAAGTSWLRVAVAADAPLSTVAATLACFAAGPARPLTAGHGLELPVLPRPGLVADAVLALVATGIRADDISVRTPSLDDVFLALTGGRS